MACSWTRMTPSDAASASACDEKMVRRAAHVKSSATKKTAIMRMAAIAGGDSTSVVATLSTVAPTVVILYDKEYKREPDAAGDNQARPFIYITGALWR